MIEVTTDIIATQGHFDKAMDRIVAIATQGHFLHIVNILSQSVFITRHDGGITINKTMGINILKSNSKVTISS